MPGGKIDDQGFSLGDVAYLSGRQDEAERIAQSIDDRMDLGSQPAAGASDRTSVRLPVSASLMPFRSDNSTA
jgi:hypothetical protein